MESRRDLGPRDRSPDSHPWGSLAVALGRLGHGVRLGPVGDRIANGAGVATTIGNRGAGRAEIGPQPRHGNCVGALPRTEREAQRPAPGIDDDRDLRAQSGAGSSDGVIGHLFFPSAACGCARTI